MWILIILARKLKRPVSYPPAYEGYDQIHKFIVAKIKKKIFSVIKSCRRIKIFVVFAPAYRYASRILHMFCVCDLHFLMTQQY